MQTTRFLFQAKRMTLTYGVLPSRDVFEECWLGYVGPEREYEIANSKELWQMGFGLGGSFDSDGLWRVLLCAIGQFERGGVGAERFGSFASDILGTFGIEWV